ncbi:hypothetical protein CHRYSEOSP005_10080 [Chryseobacterium sp. Alg-005]|uniref:acyltransferase family protein n=1 Tax=Chryseobacterium sp. Alg-005 TaxID=3159516 RepID=UPI003555AE0A
MNVKIDRIHFHTFDSLRFISFLFVFLHHSSIPENTILHYFSRSGGIGVAFFFVLSGFLITYILILEKINNHNKIPLKKFFKRRILRIWPLYYAMVFFAFCTPLILSFLHLPYSDEGYSPKWFFTLTFLENYMMMYTGSFPNVSPLRVMWSLCIEEHFYIIWGLILYGISLKNIPKLILISIIIPFIAKIIYGIYHIPPLDIFTNLDYFAFGAIPAYIFIFRKDIIKRVNEIPAGYKYLFSGVVLIIIVVLSNTSIITDLKYVSLILGVLFSTLILFTLGEKNVFKISDKSVFAWLGKYTYGLYLIHLICIIFLTRIGSQYHLNWVVTVILSFLMTVLLSFLSYHLFEKQFLKLKKSA